MNYGSNPGRRCEDGKTFVSLVIHPRSLPASQPPSLSLDLRRRGENMEEERGKEMEEIEETSPLLGSSTATTTNNETSTLESNKTVRTKVPEVEVHLYKQGKGPIAVFKSALGGWDQDQLEVRDILHKYGFKAIYAFNAVSGRAVPIRFHPKNGRSILPYKDGAVIHIDGEPQDPLIKPITKILLSIAFIVALITLLYSDNSKWLNKLDNSKWLYKLRLKSSGIPPWVIACVVVLFTRLRKRTKNFLKSRGWGG